MIKRLVLASAMVAGLALPALAGTCPLMSNDVTEAIAKSSLPAAKKAEIKKLRDRGDALHKAGKHKESVTTFEKAWALLKQ